MTPATAELEVIEPETKKSVEEVLRDKINTFKIVPVTDAVSFKQADENIKTLNEMKNWWEGSWAKIKKSAHETWKGIVEKEKFGLDSIESKKVEQRSIAKAWADEQERIRIAAERKAQEAARKQAEDEALALATQLEKDGDKEQAAAVISAPVPVPQVVVKSSVPAGCGKMTQKHYSATVTDIKALAKAVLEGKVPEMAIVGNDVFLNSQARMMKESMNYPGVTVNIR
jgi:hypothetical protein